MKRRAFGAVIACALAASCSATDPMTQLGLTPGSLQATGAGVSPLQVAMETGLSAAATPQAPPPHPEAESPGTAEGDVSPPLETAALVAKEDTPEREAGEQVAIEPAAASESAVPAQDEAPPEDEQVAEIIEPDSVSSTNEALARKRGFLASLFSPSAQAAEPPKAETPKPAAEPAEPETRKEEPAKSIVALASNTEATPMRASFGAEALPGVRRSEQLFEIMRKSSIDDTSDIDLYEEEGLYQVASAAGLARLAPNGLLKQRESVDVACLKPALIRILKTIEGHFGKPVMITSGYRDPEYNRRVRGARNSMHMYCAAADIQVQGVSKWELARFARSLPGRGGVGTYCHINSVHVDVGPERDWNWRCRRKG